MAFTNTYKSSAEIMRNYTEILEGKDPDDSYDEKRQEKVDADEAAKKKADEKKASNVKESSSELLTRYAAILAEDEYDDEDPDVAKADKERGKDGKTQSDSEKKLPPWLKGKLDKKDKEAENKGAKKAKKDKDL